MLAIHSQYGIVITMKAGNHPQPETKGNTMRKEIMLATLNSATKGANIVVAWHRVCKVRKSCSDVITKSVRTVGRVGIDYNKQAVVKEKRESGELPEQAQPIWQGAGEWEIFPFLIRHVKSGQNYLRLFNGTSKSVVPSVKFFRNGIECSKESVESELLASEKGEKDGDCFCCKVEDMTEISWHPADDIADSVDPTATETETETVPA